VLRVAAFTGGKSVPSARFRIRQYIPPLNNYGIIVTEHFSSAGAYPPSNKYLRPLWGIANLGEALTRIAKSYLYDVTLLQREFFSTFVTFEPLTKAPRILDVDDAIWLHKRGNFAEHLAGISDEIICGNNFLADHFSRWNNNVVVLPTAVDSNRYLPLPENIRHNFKIIGWSGTSSGFKYLYAIEKGLGVFLRANPNVTLRIVSDVMPKFNDIPPDRIEFIRWNPEAEVRAIQEMTVGIMPLADTLWERGKCSYKMLLYMSCGIPVIVSPVGMNKEILSYGEVGLSPSTVDDWIDAMSYILSNKDKALEMGLKGRTIVLERYSLLTLTPVLAKILSKYRK